jgi:glutamyl/glutaminyl-tRNA synthetase
MKSDRGIRVVLPAGEEAFDDGRLGPRVQNPTEQCGDLLLRDRLNSWTYQFAVTVGDMRHCIALVVRGEDLLPSAGRQIRLARLLGRSDPAGVRTSLPDSQTIGTQAEQGQR